MRQRTSRATFVKPRTSANPLAEGLVVCSIKLPMRGRVRNWKLISNKNLLAYAKAYCAENNITKSSELRTGPNRDTGLEVELRKRKLVDRLFEKSNFEEVTLQGKTFRIPLNMQRHRDWKVMSDDDIIAYAKAYCKEKGITRSSRLQVGPSKNNSLFDILKERNLTDRVFERRAFDERTLQGKTFKLPLNSQGKINWKAVSTKDLLEFTMAYLSHNEITRPKQLERKYVALYIVLQRRKLLRTIFSEIESDRQDRVLGAIADALASFGGKSE